MKTMLYSFTVYIKVPEGEYDMVDESFSQLTSALSQGSSLLENEAKIDWDDEPERDKMHDEEE